MEPAYSFLQRYGKAIFATLAAVATIAVPQFSSDHRIDPSEGVAIVLAIANAVTVFIVPIAPGARWVKTAASFVFTISQVLGVVILGGIDGNDVVILIAAAAGFFGVAIAPAVSRTEAGPVVAKTGLTD